MNSVNLLPHGEAVQRQQTILQRVETDDRLATLAAWAGLVGEINCERVSGGDSSFPAVYMFRLVKRETVVDKAQR
ncbi:hypothetical protein CQZ93_15300 [Ochrobactrum vermis]|nr:hypothetical protein CQZ93_15300 [Ochrobactrum vermis]